jgi:uncharacterized protein (TIGR02246 family)
MNKIIAALGLLLLFVAPVFAEDAAAPAADANVAAPAADTAAPAKPAKKMKAMKAAGGDEEGIKKTFSEVSEAWATGDAKALAAHFTDDSSIINPMGMEGHGKAEVLKVIQGEFEGPMKGTQQTFDDFNFTWVMPNLALVDCTGTVTGMKKPDGTDADPMKIHVYGVVVNRGKGWQSRAIRAYAFLKPPAAEDAAASDAAAPEKKAPDEKSEKADSSK